jgi:hypothetical protein
MAEKENTSFSFTHCCSVMVLAGVMQCLHEMLEVEKQVLYFLTEALRKQYEQSKLQALSSAYHQQQCCGTTILPCFLTTTAAIRVSASTMTPVPMAQLMPASVLVSWCFANGDDMERAVQELQCHQDQCEWMGMSHPF